MEDIEGAYPVGTLMRICEMFDGRPVFWSKTSAERWVTFSSEKAAVSVMSDSTIRRAVANGDMYEMVVEE